MSVLSTNLIQILILYRSGTLGTHQYPISNTPNEPLFNTLTQLEHPHTTKTLPLPVSVCIHSTVQTPPRLVKFTLHPPKSVEVQYADGSIFNLSAEFLRVNSPAADSKIRSIGGEKVIYGRSHVGIMSAETIGNYGIRIIFDDLHKTGIYTWDYFYHLGGNKFALMKNYIKTLKKHRLSRDPQRRN